MSKYTFGDKLQEFVLAIDIVDKNTFDNIWRISEKYIKKYLQFDSIKLKIISQTNLSPGLLTVKGPHKGSESNSLYNEDGSIRGLSSFCYLNQKPIWIVDKEQKHLSEATDPIELWSGIKDIPFVKNYRMDEVLTTVYIPAVQDGNPYGVVGFDSLCWLEPTNQIRKELLKATNIVSQIFKLQQASITQSENTKDAVEILGSSLGYGWPKFVKPKMFISFPKQAGIKGDVIGVIRNIVDEYRDIVEPIFWDEINETGDVNDQIIKQISESKYGVCYFSEPAKEITDNIYTDNPNVLVEAGMFMSLAKLSTSEMVGWIPIREESSPETPFDFIAQRTIIIRRLSNGNLNEEVFTKEFKNRLDALVEEII